MLLSMTGYGRVIKEFGQKTISVEIKSLNSKFLDLKLRTSQNIRDKELQIRKILTPAVIRGKCDVLVDYKDIGENQDFALNKPLFKAYFKQLKEVSDELGIDGDYVQTIIRMPDVVESANEGVTDEEWKMIAETIKETAEKLTNFRREEGEAMKKDLLLRAANISKYLDEISQYEEDRKKKMRERLTNLVTNEVPKDAIDQNRFEQEVLYYLEKIDITEEKTRLKQHCKYFQEELDKNSKSKGKKLNFISQEMGREINTIGSKANHSKIQYWVVQMKDDLEKIKEQLANSL